ncbi:MAG TPA: hypothetical protein PLL69_10000, partial [Gemmatimonadales bacterium]|nr:hypothetical protein [Gemmatimonadales bacterium]
SVHNLGLLTYGQLVLRSFGTKNMYSATSLDQLPHMLAALQMFGNQLLMPVPDVDRTDLFICLGANPLASNGSIMIAPDIRGRLKAMRDRGGRVIVQTRQVDHPALQFAARHDAEGFLAAELANRNSPSYPPLTSLARLVASGPDSAEVQARVTAMAEWSERAIARGGHALLVLGPAPCPVERVRGEWRWHILVKGDPAALGRWVRTVGPRLAGSRRGVRMSLDREPVNLL